MNNEKERDEFYSAMIERYIEKDIISKDKIELKELSFRKPELFKILKDSLIEQINESPEIEKLKQIETLLVNSVNSYKNIDYNTISFREKTISRNKNSKLQISNNNNHSIDIIPNSNQFEHITLNTKFRDDAIQLILSFDKYTKDFSNLKLNMVTSTGIESIWIRGVASLISPQLEENALYNIKNIHNAALVLSQIGNKMPDLIEQEWNSENFIKNIKNTQEKLDIALLTKDSTEAYFYTEKLSGILKDLQNNTTLKNKNI